jgi:8-amino-7-oxononanoate synthase
VYFASGHLIGAAALSSLETDESVFFIDEMAHFSLFDATRIANRPVVTFRHCDLESLSQAIRDSLPAGAKPIVVSDGVFGTTGRIAPLNEYEKIVRCYEGRLIVDEAHSFGVLGAHGRGAAELHGVESLGTTAAAFSKAFCAQGAIMGCARDAAKMLRQVPPLRAANAGSPISAAVSAASLRYMQAHPGRRVRLLGLTTHLRRSLRSIGIDTGDSPAPIVAFEERDRQTSASLQQQLFERGIYVMLSNYIGVSANGSIDVPCSPTTPKRISID